MIVEIDARYRHTWDLRAIAHVAGVSTTTAGKILLAVRGPKPAPARPSHDRRTRFLFSDVMWSSDTVDLGDGRLLIKTLDEASLFKVGWDPTPEETAEAVAAHARDILERMRRVPLIWKFDHQGAFTGEPFQAVLREYGIVPYPIRRRARRASPPARRQDPDETLGPVRGAGTQAQIRRPRARCARGCPNEPSDQYWTVLPLPRSIQ